MQVRGRSTRGTRRRVWPTLLVVMATLGLAAPSALADDNHPSDQDVQNAKNAVTQAAASVASMEVQLAQLSANEDAAQVKVQQAGEVYARAQAVADQAKADAKAAAQQSTGADAAAETARVALVQVARQLASTGGSTDMLESVLSANGFSDVAERTNDLNQVTGKTDQSLQAYKAAQLVAHTLSDRAKTKAAAASAAQATEQAALGKAQQAQSAAQTLVDSADAQRNVLLTQLAAAQQTSVQVQQQRQADIEAAAQAAAAAAAQARAAAAAKAAAEAARQASQSRSSSGSSGGGSSSGSSGGSGYGTGTSQGSAAGGTAAVAWAMTQVGKPYVWGADGPGSYDCSGLTAQAWAHAGVALPHYSVAQYAAVKKVAFADLRPGDLVFWSTGGSDPALIYHVALWLGDNKILEAPSPGSYVRVSGLYNYVDLMPFGGRP